MYAQPDDHISHGCACTNPPHFAFRRSQYVFGIRSMTRASDWLGSDSRFLVLFALFYACHASIQPLLFVFMSFETELEIFSLPKIWDWSVEWVFCWVACCRFAIHVVWQLMFMLSGGVDAEGLLLFLVSGVRLDLGWHLFIFSVCQCALSCFVASYCCWYVLLSCVDAAPFSQIVR